MNFLLKHITVFSLLILVCAIVSVEEGTAQATVTGTITSLNGKPIPDLVIQPSPYSPATIFDDMPKVRPDEHGRYEITFEEPGIYIIRINAVFHKSSHIRLIVFDQGVMDMDIRLIPVSYNNGRYFDEKSYTDWIRAYGNFNNYDFFSGAIFTNNPDGSISTTIPVTSDTVHYQVRGIGGGPAPLPGEPITEIRDDNTFEGIIIPPASADSVTLRFDPDAPREFPLTIPESIFKENLYNQMQRALLTFENPNDFYWVEPAYLVNRTRVPVVISDKNTAKKKETLKKNSEPPHNLFQYSAVEANNQRLRLRNVLREKNLHEQQRAALKIAYLGLLEQEIRWNQRQKDERPAANNTPNLRFLKEITETVHPHHPLWGHNHNAAVQLLTFSNFDDGIVKYTEQMVRGHENDMVVRNLVLKLIEENAAHFDHYEDMPEYRWIIERYGENNLARKAIVAFHRNR